MSYDKDNWTIPNGLSRKARKLALALAKLAEQRNWFAGQKVFYSPQEWNDRGEPFGKNAALIILHEGGDHAPFFSMDYSYEAGSYEDYENQINFLKDYGFWSEGMYRWSSAIYED